MNEFFFNLLRQLEGHKTNLKFLHWNATNTAQHNLAGDILATICTLQDEIAEQGFYDFGKFAAVNEFYAIADYSENLKQAIENIILNLSSFRTEIEMADIVNVLALVDDAIGAMKKFKYLADFNV